MEGKRRKRKLEQQIFQNKECEQVLQVVNYTTASHPPISFCQWLSLLRNSAWFIYMTQEAERVFMFGFAIHFSICPPHFSSLHINIRSYLMLSQTFVFSSVILSGWCCVAAAIQDVPYIYTLVGDARICKNKMCIVTKSPKLEQLNSEVTLLEQLEDNITAAIQDFIVFWCTDIFNDI